MSDDLIKKALAKLHEAASLLVEHSPPGDELENAETKVVVEDAQRLVDGRATP